MLGSELTYIWWCLHLFNDSFDKTALFIKTDVTERKSVVTNVSSGHKIKVKYAKLLRISLAKL